MLGNISLCGIFSTKKYKNQQKNSHFFVERKSENFGFAGKIKVVIQEEPC
jgi:hypothetical protein